jgi:hypothetical protein
VPQTAAERPDLRRELLAVGCALVVVQASRPAVVDRIPHQALRELPQSGSELLCQPAQQALAGVMQKAFEQCLLKGQQPRVLVRSRLPRRPLKPPVAGRAIGDLGGLQ